MILICFLCGKVELVKNVKMMKNNKNKVRTKKKKIKYLIKKYDRIV
ncbi:hypothetical protein HMPREF0379_1605 [[Eubacterium] yurii subsp. margaretiae ATCC 43715]|nr:hypothetical protein HMPREF0379_1605 [[Eubacterium] yurii subsp. margaretiae ATCC 43715]